MIDNQIKAANMTGNTDEWDFKSQRVKDMLAQPFFYMKSANFNNLYSNAELVEIIKSSEAMDSSTTGSMYGTISNKLNFYSQLLLGQTIKFDQEVFDEFVPLIHTLESFAHLLNNSQSRSKSNDIKVMEYISTVPLADEVIIFYQRREFEDMGIDIMTSPYNYIVLTCIMYFSSPGFMDNNSEFIWDLLGSLSSKKIIEWYQEFITNDTTGEDHDIFITSYPKMSTVLLDALFDSAGMSAQLLMGSHKEASIELKNAMFDKTGDIKYIPMSAADAFLF